MSFRAALATAAVLIGGLVAFWLGTDGFRAVTAEGARRLAVTKEPRALPPVALEDQSGAVFSLDKYKGTLVLLEFVYTRCPDICPLLGMSFERIRDHVQRSSLRDRVVLLTVSFDPLHDGPAELMAYADRFGGAGGGWRFARPRNADELEALLKASGTIVKPDGYGGFVHNAAIHVIDQEGRLARIFDADAVDQTIAELERRAG